MTSVVEGLAHSEDHCARVLSVSGFLVIIARFPLGEWFILRGERPLSEPGKPLPVDVTHRCAHPGCVTGAQYRTSVLYTACTAGGVPTRGGRGGIYPGWEGPTYTREGDTSLRRGLILS